jgi:hypothetical protein
MQEFDKYQRQTQKKHEWLRLLKYHRKSEIENRFKEMQRTPDKAYVISIKHTNFIPKPPSVRKPSHPQFEPGTKFSIKYFASLFSQEIEDFYGRTYCSGESPLTEIESYLKTRNSDYFYLHTDYPSAKSKLVIEVVLIEEGSRGKKEYYGCGFTFIPIFSHSGVQTNYLFNGSPRILLTGGSQCIPH